MACENVMYAIFTKTANKDFSVAFKLTFKMVFMMMDVKW